MDAKELLMQALKDVAAGNAEVKVEGGFFKDKSETEEVSVGKISDALRKHMNDQRDKAEDLEEEMDLYKDQLALEAKKKFKEKFGQLENEMHDNHHRIWNEVYSELSLDPDGNYSVNRCSGEVTQRMKKKTEKTENRMDGFFQ